MQEGAEIGVLEAVNKDGDAPFDDDDQFFLTAIAETVSSALKNASLMFAERKLEILEALVRDQFGDHFDAAARAAACRSSSTARKMFCRSNAARLRSTIAGACS